MIRKQFFPLIFIVCLLCPLSLFSAVVEGENLKRVKLFLTERSIPFEERQLLADYGGFGSSILVRDAGSPGENTPSPPVEAPGTFVLAVPLDAQFAVDTGLFFAETIREKNGSPNIIIAFLGNETNELPSDMGGRRHSGLRDLLSLVDMPENWIVCYLDADKPPKEIIARHGGSGYVAPLDLISPLPGTFNAGKIPWSFRVRYNELYKLRLVEGPEALSIIRGEEIHGFVLSGAGEDVKSGRNFFPGKNIFWRSGDSPEKSVSSRDMASLLVNYSSALEQPVLAADSHYSIFSFYGGNVFFLTERLTAALVIITSGVLLFFFLAYAGRFNAILIFNTRLFFRNIWMFFVFLALMVFSVRASGALYSLLYGAFGPSASGIPGADAEAGANYLGAALTILLASLFFFLPSPLLSFFRFPRRARFYGFSSVIFITLELAFAALLDFSYVFIFLWAFFFIVLGAAIRKPAVVFVCAGLAPLFALGAIVNVVETGSGRIAELFVSSPWRSRDAWLAAVQFALLSLPIILLARRGIILIERANGRGREVKQTQKFRLVVIPVLTALVFLSMIVQARFIPRINGLPERRFAGREEGTEENLRLLFELDDVIFQDSRILTLRLQSPESPVRFDLALLSAGGENLLPVYSAPVPFQREADGREIHFLLGENPPNPLVMEIVVPLEFSCLLKAAAVHSGGGGRSKNAPALPQSGETGEGAFLTIVEKTLPLTPPLNRE